MTKSCAILASVLLISNALSAEDNRSVLDLSFEELFKVKVSTASKMSEPKSEIVVPLTVITREMINGSQARTLKDLLITYVPGMTNVQDQNEVNIAMRGIYTSAQQKILFLLNGHRLNSHVYSMATPDHAMSLQKIKQVEILRGPGSSVYGNVALTAVVNIVTFEGSEVDGWQSELGLGNFGQKQVSTIYGQSFDQGDFFSWFNFYQSDGEVNTITPENNYARSPLNEPVDSLIGAFKDQPSIDTGFTLDYKNWSFIFNYHRSHLVSSFSDASLSGEAYHYDDYERLHGIGPGNQSKSLHFGLSHVTELDNGLSWKNDLFYDRNDLEATFVFDPSVQLFGLAAMYDKSHGISSQLMSKQERSEWLLGYRFETFKAYKSKFPFGVGGTFIGQLFDDNSPLVTPGKEDTHSIYALHKYRLNRHWLSNIGARFDSKDRLTREHQKKLSPRLGLVYDSLEDFTFKVSYSESFVDPAYWNRYGNLPSFRGSVDLEPEELSSFQITPSWFFLDSHMSWQVNFFYNSVENFIFRNNQAAANEPIFTNSGKLESYGIENELGFQKDNWKFHWVSYFQKVKSFENFSASDDKIYNIPNITMSFILTHQWNDRWNTELTTRYIGTRHSPIIISLDGVQVTDPFPNAGVDYYQPNNKEPAEWLVNASVNYKVSSTFNIGFSAFNLFDEDYYEGGTTLHPYKQEGRWWMLKLNWQPE